MQQAVAQTAAAKGDWMAMAKAQHLLISKTFEEPLASAERTYVPVTASSTSWATS